MPIATLIASEMLASGHLIQAQYLLRDAQLLVQKTEWIDEGQVVDIYFEGDLETGKTALIPLLDAIDIVVQDERYREKKLLISDMDSTMITVECIDELADYAGIKAQIAAVTERAMQGEMDFEEALRARVALLKGLNKTAIAACLKERVVMSKGAKILVETMANRGAHCVLVSGGFNQFASNVAQTLGFHQYHANELEIENDILTGHIDGAIVDAIAKRNILHAIISDNDWQKAQTLAVGDGANDIPMIEAAGLGAAYRAKPAAQNAADMQINHGDLTALLSAQGISRKDWTQ